MPKAPMMCPSLFVSCSLAWVSTSFWFTNQIGSALAGAFAIFSCCLVYVLIASLHWAMAFSMGALTHERCAIFEGFISYPFLKTVAAVTGILSISQGFQVASSVGPQIRYPPGSSIKERFSRMRWRVSLL